LDFDSPLSLAFLRSFLAGEPVAENLLSSSREEPGASKQYDHITFPARLDLCLRAAMIHSVTVFPSVVSKPGNYPAPPETNGRDLALLQESLDCEPPQR
jgi:hypothetical protein